MNTKQRFEYMRPLIEDAAKHNNRALLVDLVKPYIQYIEENFDNCVDENEEQAAKAIISYLKAYLINTAWDKGKHKSPETVGGEGTHDKGLHLYEDEGAQGTEDEDKGAGVVQANTHDGTSNAMREVFLPTDHFENTSPGHSAVVTSIPAPVGSRPHGPRFSDQRVNMCPEIQENGEKNSLDIGNDMCDSSGAAGDMLADTSGFVGSEVGSVPTAHIKTPAVKLKWDAGPFSLKDFVGEERAEEIEDKPLLELLEELKRQIEIG
jgi:hypothetical protein